jgi:phenylpyruvate tautomerase PptA (4-oxalocrotonate tautomerase family)
MPLVRIDMLKRSDRNFAERVGEIVYEAMRSTINVPEHDHFQVLCEHDAGHFVFDRTYLGIARSEALIMIQITLNEGRTIEQKKALYRAIADSLNARLGLSRGDVFVNLVEVKKENWSFGDGVAQYA